MSDLADELRISYATAPTGRKSVALFLFGIRHAAVLRNLDRQALVQRAGLAASMATELNKAINIAEYVTITRPLV